MTPAFKRAAALALVAAGVLGLAGCAKSSPDLDVARRESRNLVWIVVDTLRADALGCYGGRARTPNIDRLAAQGTRYEWAFSHFPMTAPSHLSMFTGLLPDQHHVTDNTLVVDDRFEMVAEKMLGAGISTAGVVSLGVLRSKFGFAQGFQSFDDEFTRQWFRPGGEVTESAVKLAAELAAAGRFFLFVHYADPHEPYTPPGIEYPEISVELNGREVAVMRANGLAVPIELELGPGENEVAFNLVGSHEERRFTFQQLAHGPRGVDVVVGSGWDEDEGRPVEGGLSSPLPATVQFLNHSTSDRKYPLKTFAFEELSVEEVRDRYIKEVEFVDAEIGRFIEALERLQVLDTSLVVFTADHGEGLGDHDLIGHVHQLYNSLIHVPLVLRGPGIPQSMVEEAFAFHADLYPTLAAVFGFDSSAGLLGRNLLGKPADGGNGTRHRQTAMTVSPPATANLASVLHDPWKVIVNWDSGDREIYDVRRDPNELEPITVDPERARVLQQGLQRWDPGLDGRPTGAPLSEEEIEKLRALGYVHN